MPTAPVNLDPDMERRILETPGVTVTHARPPARLPALTEAAFTDQVIELFRLFGWLVTHFRPARTASGWRTPLQGDRGWPDVVAVHERTGSVVVAELKSATGKIEPEQERWLAAWRRHCGAQVFCWRPADWGRIVEVARAG